MRRMMLAATVVALSAASTPSYAQQVTTKRLTGNELSDFSEL
jgi:hypothetical protein